MTLAHFGRSPQRPVVAVLANSYDHAVEPDTPLVSIIIPAFDVAAYLGAAIDSALAQEYPACEVVVVDDGSTDATPDIIATYGDRVVAVRQENRGLAGARNTALRHASGQIIGLLDADDVWEPSRTSRAVAELQRDPELGLVTTDAWLIEGDQPTDRRFYGGWHDVRFAATNQLDAIAHHNFVFVGAYVRHELFARHGQFDESLRRAEDYDLWTRFLLGGERFGLIDEPLAGYRVRPDSLSADPVVQRDAHLSVLAKHLDALWSRGARGRPGDAYDVARRLEREGSARAASRAYLVGARDRRLGTTARVKHVAAAVRARLGGRRPTG